MHKSPIYNEVNEQLTGLSNFSMHLHARYHLLPCQNPSLIQGYHPLLASWWNRPFMRRPKLAIHKQGNLLIPYNALFSRMPIFANHSVPPTKEFFAIVFFSRTANIRGNHSCTFAVYNSLQFFTNWILFMKIAKISRPRK